jgi:hypothetical protein
MSDFCPDGYLPSQEASFRAAKFWFPEQMASLEATVAPELQTKAESNLYAAVRAFSQQRVSDAWRHAVEEIVSQTARRLRNFLHQGTLKAYYFADDGRRHPVSSDFWATAQANGVLESGTFWPFGGPSRVLERRPNFPLFLVQSELGVLLSEELAEKRQFPQGRRPELAAAYRAPEIAMLPNRQAQRRAISELEQFRQYRITDRLFREAERASGPRDSGSKRRQHD